jgi:ribosomal protein S18 acetylase RimI-like enzyme
MDKLEFRKKVIYKEILQIQHLAFRKEAEDFNDFNIEPITQTVAILKEEYETFVFLKAVDESGQIIGSIRGYIEDGTSYIGKTLVHPDYQGQGVGTKMICTLERMNKAPRYEINASIRCPQNIRLYERLGYVIFKEIKTENNGFVYLEKLS